MTGESATEMGKRVADYLNSERKRVDGISAKMGEMAGYLKEVKPLLEQVTGDLEAFRAEYKGAIEDIQNEVDAATNGVENNAESIQVAKDKLDALGEELTIATTAAAAGMAKLNDKYTDIEGGFKKLLGGIVPDDGSDKPKA